MLAHSFLIKSSSKLLVTRAGIKARMSLISGLWFPWLIYMFFEMRFDLGTLDSGERSLPFGLLVCLLLGRPGFNCWFSFAPVFQWCCSTPQGSPGVGHNTLFLPSPHLCFIIVFICDIFVFRDDPLMR